MDPFLPVAQRLRRALKYATLITLSVVLFTAAVVVARPVRDSEAHVSLTTAAKSTLPPSPNEPSVTSVPSAAATAFRRRYVQVPEPIVVKLNSALTFYDCMDQGFCGAMANGEGVYEGAAACSYDLSFGTRFVIPGDPTNRIYVCKDRGLLPDTHVDIFWYNPEDGWRWQSAVGSWGEIQVLAGCDVAGGLDPSEPCGYVAVAE